MARINIRLDDGLLERIKGVVPEGQVSAWLVGLVELALAGPQESEAAKQEDVVTSRMLKRLDALEDFEQYILGRIAESGPTVNGAMELTVERDWQQSPRGDSGN